MAAVSYHNYKVLSWSMESVLYEPMETEKLKSLIGKKVTVLLQVKDKWRDLSQHVELKVVKGGVEYAICATGLLKDVEVSGDWRETYTTLVFDSDTFVNYEPHKSRYSLVYPRPTVSSTEGTTKLDISSSSLRIEAEMEFWAWLAHCQRSWRYYYNLEL